MKKVTGIKKFILRASPFQSIRLRSLYSKCYIVFFTTVIIIFCGCYKDLQNFNPKHLPSKPAQINFTAPNIFPEGIAYDPGHYRFFVSSASMGDIGIVTPDGLYKTFIRDNNLTGTNGLKVDKDRQRLWVCNRDNGIGAYNLTNGERIFFTDFSLLLPDVPIFINDVVIDPRGNAYVTNTVSPVIYKVTPGGNASVFFNNDHFATGPNDFGFNGIQYDKKGFLLVAFSNEVVKIPVTNPNGYSIVKLDGVFYPDGLLLSKDGKQLVVVNDTGGTPDDNVLSFISNDDWQSGTLSTSFSTGAVLPTDVTSDGNRVFVVYSHLDKLLSGENQDTFAIQEIPLKKSASF